MKSRISKWFLWLLGNPAFCADVCEALFDGSLC